MVSDYTTFYEEWASWVATAIASAGIYDRGAAEDLHQEVFESAQRDDWLSLYDASKGASWNTFIVNRILYVIRKRKGRFAYRAQYEIVDELESDVFSSIVVDDSEAFDEIAFIDSINYVERSLREIPQTSSKDLAGLFSLMVRQVLFEDGINRGELAKQLGISPQSVGNWIKSLRLCEPVKAWRSSVLN